jgi:hypothetical protein
MQFQQATLRKKKKSWQIREIANQVDHREVAGS